MFIFSAFLNQILSPHQSISNNTPNSLPTSGTFERNLPSGSTNSSYNGSEKALYITFFCLTTTFLICHLPRIILNVYEVPMSNYREICLQKFKRHYFQPSWVIILSYFEKLCLIINSSTNFLCLCLVSKMFRKQMVKVIFRRILCYITSNEISLDDRTLANHDEGKSPIISISN